MKKKRGFTLVELLAVIVILAVILIIAMPKISDVIKNSKESSLETTAKLIASQAEKKYTENQVLDNSSTIKCSDVAKISNADYESCNITFDSKGNAKVTIVGKGKFEGLQVVDGTKDSAKASVKKDVVETAAKYFSYKEVKVDKTLSVTVEDENKCISYLQTLGAPEETATTLCNGNVYGPDDFSIKSLIEGGDIPSSDYEIAGLKVEYFVKNVEVKDANKCKSYLQSKFKNATEEQATTLCTTNQAVNGLTLQQAVSKGLIPSSDYETAGLYLTDIPYVPSITITGYNIEGGTDVVIPSQIDGKTVAAIGGNAFNDSDTGLGLGITSVIIPNTITSIGYEAFRNNQIISITFPDTPITLGCGVFEGNPIVEDSSYSFPSNVTVSCVKN